MHRIPTANRLLAASTLVLLAVFPVPAASASDPSDPTCVFEDQSSGLNGQKGKCGFHCGGPAGTVAVSVKADDPDASVSGSAACPGGNAHCSSRHACHDSQGYQGEGDGSCSGDSDEFWDSGLYVSCSSSATRVACEPPQTCVDEWCPVTQPVKVCIDPLCQGTGPSAVPQPVPGSPFQSPGTPDASCLVPCGLAGGPQATVAGRGGVGRDCLTAPCPPIVEEEAEPAVCKLDSLLPPPPGFCLVCGDRDRELVARLCAADTLLWCGTGALPTLVGPPGVRSVHLAAEGTLGVAAACGADGACTLYRPAFTLEPLTGRIHWTL